MLQKWTETQLEKLLGHLLGSSHGDGSNLGTFLVYDMLAAPTNLFNIYLTRSLSLMQQVSTSSPFILLVPMSKSTPSK